ncbi:MAG: G-D-S-L family lipolytic protein [Flavobacteriales bacterium]|nr:G-D-S-L family lipolytic protein [Flavobacteriales bacterium]
MRSIISSFLLFWLCFHSPKVFSQNNFDEEVAQIVQRSEEKGLEAPVIFIGSSSIKMWQTLEQDFPDFPVLNHGFGGAEYRDLLSYENQLIEPFEPSMVVVYAGDNDLANGKDPEPIAEQADRFVDGIRRSAGGALVIIISAKPSPARWELKDKYMELNTKLKQMADGYEHVVFVDVWTPMLKRNGELNQKLFLEDGLHMNAKGYTIWKNALLPYLSK